VSLPRQKAITQTFDWGYATVSLNTKKIKGLHENDFIMARLIGCSIARMGSSTTSSEKLRHKLAI